MRRSSDYPSQDGQNELRIKIQFPISRPPEMTWIPGFSAPRATLALRKTLLLDPSATVIRRRLIIDSNVRLKERLVKWLNLSSSNEHQHVNCYDGKREMLRGERQKTLEAVSQSGGAEYDVFWCSYFSWRRWVVICIKYGLNMTKPTEICRWLSQRKGQARTRRMSGGNQKWAGMGRGLWWQTIRKMISFRMIQMRPSNLTVIHITDFLE